MFNFFDSFSNFIFSSVLHIIDSVYGYLIGGLILISSLFVLVYRMASRRF